MLVIPATPRRFLARALPVLVLLLATPASEAMRDAVSMAAGVECCDGCEDDARSGSDGCTHCVCCGHLTALSSPAARPPEGPAPAGSRPGWSADRPQGSGYRAPPFRPPAS